MPYTRPDYDAADATWNGAAAYSRPPYTYVYGTWSVDDPEAELTDAGLPAPPQFVATRGAAARLSDDSGPLQEPAFRALYGVAAWLSDGGLPSAPSFVVSPPYGWLADSGLPLAPTFTARHTVGMLSDSGLPLAPSFFGFGDFTAAVDPLAPTHYVADLIVDGEAVRVPISSWSATLRTGSESYASCVVSACAVWLDALNAATEFAVYRRGQLLGGTVFEQEIVRAPLQTLTVDQGSYNHTASLSGYSDAFEASDDPDARYDRTLTGVRAISTYGTGMRVRCAIDWLLRPGQRALLEGEVGFAVTFINYYGLEADAYMDVGFDTV